MPKLGQPGAHGDLLVRFEVEFPSELPAQRGDNGGLREQLRPFIDPKAPANPRTAGSGGWFGLGGKGAQPVAAARPARGRAKEVEELLAARERELRAEREGRDQRGGAECRQM
mmetsp:Transcript_95757/g.290826  ORF Transcript_95757/g.290826 Transcript_95757/m.290826 type:complete len:113 (+) Transcript_95757:418-756(+)